MRRLVVLAPVLLVSALLVSCSQSNSNSSHAVDLHFHKDVAVDALPLDSFQPDPDNVDYARQLIISKCMTAAKLPFVVIRTSNYRPPTYNIYQRSLFNISIARQDGYHAGHSKSDPNSVPTEPQYSGAQQSVLDSCTTKANKTITGSADYTNFIQSLGAQAYDYAQRSAATNSAVQRWRKCMLPLGLGDLPATPTDMPSRSQTLKFGMAGKQNVVAPSLDPSTLEIRQATFDAKCRDSSGYSSGFYNQEVAEELALISSNSTKVSSAIDAFHAEAAKVSRIIDTNGG